MVWIILNNVSQWDGLSHILWKNMNQCLKPPTSSARFDFPNFMGIWKTYANCILDIISLWNLEKNSKNGWVSRSFKPSFHPGGTKWRHLEAPRGVQTSQANRASPKSLKSLKRSEQLSYTRSRHTQAVYTLWWTNSLRTGTWPSRKSGFSHWTWWFSIVMGQFTRG